MSKKYGVLFVLGLSLLIYGLIGTPAKGFHQLGQTIHDTQSSTEPEIAQVQATVEKTPVLQEIQPSPGGSSHIATTPESRPLNDEVEMSDRSKELLKGFSKPENAIERKFTVVMGTVYDSNVDLSSQEIKNLADQFRGADGYLYKYISRFLRPAASLGNQKLRNFIYEFARNTNTEESFTQQILRDLVEIRTSGLQGSIRDEAKLVAILLAQSDLSSSEKRELLESVGLQQYIK